ncbi:zf-HC2 domain-containing protein [Paenibacillus athensensis]|uniref:Putative zinc-finger domain-containing protein n=1 Tax=Paenibacillus athensensis TaxID=1967502 RepID=A0A4Y8Q452_9BACL|nr:zf-HC2 domain-containing protein [Paenibacillus athensensis]MCD1260918.1 zf-HC2 domain-containing protein [Paenibacillus athensensis]
MKHFDSEHWQRYVRNEELSAAQRDEMEWHLQHCEACLEHYMSQVEASMDDLPMMETGEAEFADQLIRRTMRTRRSLFRSSLLHYGIAAAATLILVVSGVFQGLTQEVNAKMLNSPRQPDQTSISDQLMNHTLSWLDKIKKEDDNGGFFP